ncbi:hypothetical protein Pcinc_016856 [Petrolisthes cinctipes]|uniref:Uncharacterized protein n=1 Tax=Petrolisthes cinctipes TaxID=88211 RepID=A0AAE1KPB8_PETCI|nr:hypothetical protein Pcinc_016856 [Petrolisthes cinctipes]
MSKKTPKPGDSCDSPDSVALQYDQPANLRFDDTIPGYACTQHSWVLEQYSQGLTDCHFVLDYDTNFVGMDTSNDGRELYYYEAALRPSNTQLRSVLKSNQHEGGVEMNSKSLVAVNGLLLLITFMLPAADTSMECKRAAGQTSPQQPQHCQTITVPLTPNHESVQPWKICKDKMVELEVVLMPTGTSAFTGIILEVVQASQNYTPIGKIGFDYRPSGGNRRSINEFLRLNCLRDRGRVKNPWTTTTTTTNSTQLTAINITLQSHNPFTFSSLTSLPPIFIVLYPLFYDKRIYTLTSVSGFPYHVIKLSCQVRQLEGGCGEVFSDAISDYRKVPSSWLGMKINTTKTEMEGNVEVMQNDLSFRSLPHNTSWLIKVAYSIGTWIHLSYTSNDTLGNHWVNMQCSTKNTSDDKTTTLYENTTATSPPPRSYLIQVGPDWMRVTDTTVDRNVTTSQINCTQKIPNFPNLTFIVYSSRDYGRVSYPCRTGLINVNATQTVMQCSRWRVDNITLARAVMKMLVVMVVVAGILVESLTWLWTQYLDIDLSLHLSPLCVWPPLCCRSPPSSPKLSVD